MKRIPIALVISAAAVVSAVAGDNNGAFLIQVSPEGSYQGNTLSIDQSGASDSLVRGIGSQLIGTLPTLVLGAVAGSDPTFATQRGEANHATIKMTGNGGELQVLQRNFVVAPFLPTQAGGGNTASLTTTGDALGGLIQVGNGNTANMTLDNGATGLIAQWGTSLSATLDVASNGSGTVVQIGNNSSVGTVSVLSGNTVTYTQIGSNLAPGVSPQIYSTVPGSITITQTAFGTRLD